MEKTKRPTLDEIFKSPIQKEDLELIEEVDIKVIRGKKGDKGDTSTKEEILSLIKPLIPVPLSPKEIGTKELLPLISSLIPEVKDGKTPTKEELLKIIEPLIPLPGKDGSPDSAKEIVEKINKGQIKIQRSKIEGFENVESQIANVRRNLMNIGGVRQTRIASNGVVVSTGATTIDFMGANVFTPIGNDGSTTRVSLTTPSVGIQTNSSTTPSINTDIVGLFSITGQTANITSFTTNLTGSPTLGQKLIIQITGTGTITLSWGTAFEASTITLPTSTVGTNMLTVGFLYNSATSKWTCVAAV